MSDHAQKAEMKEITRQSRPDMAARKDGPICGTEHGQVGESGSVVCEFTGACR